MSATPRASFVIPARNAAGTLARTLDSLLAQGDRAWEALIVDDGSSDDTPRIVAAYAQRDTRFVGLRGSATQGAAAADDHESAAVVGGIRRIGGDSGQK